MKILVIYAHPETKGFCSFIRQKTESFLSQRELNYEVLDLYRNNYDPILKSQEHYTAGNDKVSEKNKKLQEKIKNSEKLIFIYPVWWATMPAFLKGFLDRVFVPGFAFTYKEKSLRPILPKGLLREKEATVFQTLGGSSWMYWLTGNPPKRVIKFFTLFYSGISTKVVQIFNANELTDQKRKNLTKRVERELEKLIAD